MEGLHSLDALVRARLRKWPQRPPGLAQTDPTCACWLRGRPSDDLTACFPFLKFPGSNRMRTLPDGLWLNFGGSTTDPYVDVFAIEACGSLQNLLDKRFRFAPSTQSMLAVCPVPWLLAPADQDDPTPRWRRIFVLREAPGLPLVAPVRDIRVMYALRRGQYPQLLRDAGAASARIFRADGYPRGRARRPEPGVARPGRTRLHPGRLSRGGLGKPPEVCSLEEA